MRMESSGRFELPPPAMPAGCTSRVLTAHIDAAAVSDGCACYYECVPVQLRTYWNPEVNQGITILCVTFAANTMGD